MRRMANIVLLVGLGFIGFLLAYLFFNFGKDEISQKHYLLRLLLIGCLFGVFVLIGKAGLDSTQTCNHVLSNMTLVENNTVELYDYETLCYESDPNNTAKTFYVLTLWIVRLISAYILVYLFYEIFIYMRNIISGKRGRSK